MPYTEIEIPLSPTSALDGQLALYSQMLRSERDFLRIMIEKFMPHKALELGVAHGASSALILDALCHDGLLFSVDYLEKYYRDPTKNTGWACQLLVPMLQNKWHLFTGGLAAKFMDKIGGGVDFVLLDTMHLMPGELLDFLFVYPFLSNDVIVVIHDISVFQGRASGDIQTSRIPCRLLFSLLPGVEKFVPSNADEPDRLPNIGAVHLDVNTNSIIDDIFSLLELPWCYQLTDDDVAVTKEFVSRHYGGEYGRLFTKIATRQKTEWMEMGSGQIRTPRSIRMNIRRLLSMTYNNLMDTNATLIKRIALRVRIYINRWFR